jgi:hypothetical protein
MVTGFGIDTIRVVVPLAGRMLRETKVPNGGTAFSYLGNAYVEASLPKREYGHNWTPLPIRDLYGALTGLMVDLSRVAPIDTDELDIMRLRVNRLDVPRDFDNVEDIGNVLLSLACAPRAGRVHTHLHRRGASSHFQTLEVGNGSWGDRIYDKHEESRGQAPAGRMRNETQYRPARFRTAWCRQNGGAIHVVGDISEQKCWALTTATFMDVGFNQVICERDVALRRVLDLPGMDPTEKARVWLLLCADAAGEDTDMPVTVVRDYRRLLRSMGICLSKEMTGRTRRLDWMTGTMLDMTSTDRTTTVRELAGAR